MLYPEFHDLVAYKRGRFGKVHAHSYVTSHDSGQHHSPFRGQGLEFDAVREYVIGDDIRSIDWRVTARVGTPHLKVFTEERERTQFLCVDRNQGMRFGTKKTFKSVQAAHAAAILGWRALRQHDKVGACLFGDVPNGMQLYSPKRTTKAFCKVLQTLSLPEENSYEVSFEKTFELLSSSAPTGALIYLISDFSHAQESFPEETALRRLVKKCTLVFIAIDDPADYLLYPYGELLFSQKGQNKVRLDISSQSGREAYAAEWKASRENLRALAMRYGISLIELSTESDIAIDLAKALKKVAKR